MTFDFKKQLKVGDEGEQLIFCNYHKTLDWSKDKKWDFNCVATGNTIELKTDTYDMDKTKNFFFERFSDVSRETPGGPWRTHEHGVDTFVYLFVKNGIYFNFENPEKLIERLNDLTEKKGLVYIKNRGWTTAGYKVSRDDVIDLATIHEI